MPLRYMQKSVKIIKVKKYVSICIKMLIILVPFAFTVKASCRVHYFSILLDLLFDGLFS